MKLDIYIGKKSQIDASTRGYFERVPSFASEPSDEKYLYCGNYRFRERDYNDPWNREKFERYFKAVQRRNPDFEIVITETDTTEPDPAPVRTPRYFRVLHDGTASRDFSALLDSVETELNNDADLVADARRANEELANSLSDLLANSINHSRIGESINDLLYTTPRYRYQKNIRFGDHKFDLEIDMILWQAWLFEV